MAIVEGTGGPVRSSGTKKKNDQFVSGAVTGALAGLGQIGRPASGSSNASGPSGAGGYDLSALQSLYAQQQALAAEAERQRRAAAQAAYERSMAALNAAYNGQAAALQSNYNATLSQLESDFDQGAAAISQNAGGALQQAYINKMMTLKALPQQLAAQGLSGGAAETTLAGVHNDYGNARADIEAVRGQELGDLAAQLNANKSQALAAYNTQLSDAQAARLAYQMQLEQNLANAVASAAADGFDQKFTISSQYLEQMAKLQSQMASAAAGANKKIEAGNSQKALSVQQSELVSQVYDRAYKGVKGSGGTDAEAQAAGRSAAVEYLSSAVSANYYSKAEANLLLDQLLLNRT